MTYLDKTSRKMLKYIKNKPQISLETLNKKYQSNTQTCINFLLEEKLIERKFGGYCLGQPTYKNIYTISARGFSYFENHRKEQIKFWIPIIISNAIALTALIVSIFALNQ